jgi:hypothetical protein
MTIGISSVCHAGELILMSADMRGSYEHSNEKHERIGKQFQLPTNLWVNIAGDPRVCNSVVSIVTEAITQIQERGQPVIYQNVRDAMASGQFQELRFALDCAFINTLNISRTEWQSLCLSDAKAYRRAKAIFKLTSFEVEMTVGGFVLGQPILLMLWGKQPVYPETNFSIVGDGWREAQRVLDRRAQNTYMSISRTLVHFSEAMNAARANRTVGEPADYVLLHAKGIRRIPSEFADRLAERYKDKDTKPLDTDQETLKEVMSATYEHKMHKVGEEQPQPKLDSLDDLFEGGSDKC